MSPFSGRIYKFFLSAILLLFFSNCFDYEETLTINHDFSGTLEVSYIVPTRRNSDESLIKFLPTQKDEILGRLNKGFFLETFPSRIIPIKRS